MTDKKTNYSTENILSLEFWGLPLCCFLVALVTLSISSTSYSFGSVGTNDFIEYWSAFHVAHGGANPYESGQLLKAQQTIVPERTQPLMMWNPPWLLGLLAPILRFDFLTASKIWFALNIFFVLASAKIMWGGLFEEKSLLLPSILAVAFIPIGNALQVGQVSLLVLFLCSLLLLALKQERYFLAGVAICLLTVKPHLAYLLLAVIFWFSLLNYDRFIKLSLGFGLSLGFLTLITCALSANLIPQYLQIQFNQSGVTGVSEWLGAVPMAYLRLGLLRIGYGYSDAPLLLFPVCVSLITITWLVVRRPKISWENAGPSLIAISVATASFGWLFDLSLLFIPLLWQLQKTLDLHSAVERLRLTCMLFALLIAGALALYLENPLHHYFAWLPLVFLFSSNLKMK